MVCPSLQDIATTCRLIWELRSSKGRPDEQLVGRVPQVPAVKGRLLEIYIGVDI